MKIVRVFRLVSLTAYGVVGLLLLLIFGISWVLGRILAPMVLGFYCGVQDGIKVFTDYCEDFKVLLKRPIQKDDTDA